MICFFTARNKLRTDKQQSFRLKRIEEISSNFLNFHRITKRKATAIASSLLPELAIAKSKIPESGNYFCNTITSFIIKVVPAAASML